MTVYRTIAVQTRYGVQIEGVASGTVTPGMLLERTSATAPTYKAHATAGGNLKGPKIVALEDDLQGASTTTDYATGVRLFCRAFQPGDLVAMILADGETAAVGAELESNGAGLLQTYTADIDIDSSAVTANANLVADQIVGIAEEAVDLSASANLALNQHILVRIS